MKTLLFLLLAASMPALAEEDLLLTPKITKPAFEPAAGDPLQAKYEAAWFRYEKAIGEVRDTVNAAMEAQLEMATDAGNPDLVAMWDKKKKVFLDTGTLTWPTAEKAKVEWLKKYAATAFPEEFSEVVAAAKVAFERAVATLIRDYESLIKDYTAGQSPARANALREELVWLARQQMVLVERATVVVNSQPSGLVPARDVRNTEVRKALPRVGELHNFVLQGNNAKGVGTNIRVVAGDEISYSAQGQITLEKDNLSSYPYTTPDGNPAQVRVSEKWGVQGANGSLLMVVNGKVCGVGATAKVIAPEGGEISFHLLENGKYSNNRGSYNISLGIRRRIPAVK